MSGAFDIVGFDSTYKVPRFAASIIFGAGLLTAASQPLYVLCCGMKTSDGSMVADQDVVQAQSLDQVDAYAGAGSQLARMGYAALGYRGSVPVFLAAVTEPSGGTAAQASLLIGGTWAVGGQIAVSMANTTVTYSVGAGDTIDQVGAAFRDKWNSYTRLPTTASYDSTSKKVFFVCKNKGAQGRDWLVHLDDSLAPTGMTLTLAGSATAGSSKRVRMGVSGTGTGVEDVTTILTKLQTTRFARIAAAQNDATNAGLWKTQVDTLAGPLSLILEHVIFAFNNDYTTAQTRATTLNEPRAQVLWARNCESHPCEIAAVTAAKRANTEGNGLVPDYDGISEGKGELPNIAPVRTGFEADLPLDSEIQTALSNGVTPVTTMTSKAVIVRAIVTHCLTGSAADYRTIDVGDVVVPDFVALDLQLGWTSQFRVDNPYVGPDPAPEGQPVPPGVGTPRLWNAYVQQKLNEYFKKNMIEDPTLNPPISVFDPVAQRIQSVVPLVVRRVQHQIGAIVRQQRAA